MPEHYPIVGENLLASIREVLGPAATEQVITAWAEAYGFLAEILIGREKQIYSMQERTRHGWVGFKPFRVVRTVPESEIITSFYLQPADGGAVPLLGPGVRVTDRSLSRTIEDKQPRCGITVFPTHRVEDFFRISVKQEPKGFCFEFSAPKRQRRESRSRPGPPCGEFFIDLTEKHERPLMLLSAGGVLTPSAKHVAGRAQNSAGT